jgi:hypothetical protein
LARKAGGWIAATDRDIDKIIADIVYIEAARRPSTDRYNTSGAIAIMAIA